MREEKCEDTVSLPVVEALLDIAETQRLEREALSQREKEWSKRVGETGKGLYQLFEQLVEVSKGELVKGGGVGHVWSDKNRPPLTGEVVIVMPNGVRIQVASRLIPLTDQAPQKTHVLEVRIGKGEEKLESIARFGASSAGGKLAVPVAKIRETPEGETVLPIWETVDVSNPNLLSEGEERLRAIDGLIKDLLRQLQGRPEGMKIVAKPPSYAS